jgi:flagellar motility protein MotE (MotC chaperone)
MSMSLRLTPRLLPSVIVVMAVLLAVKAVDLAMRAPDAARRADASLLSIGTPAQAARVTAEPFRAAADAPPQPAQGQNPPPGQGQAQVQLQAQAQAQAQAQDAQPGAVTAAERSVLEELRARRASLDAREQALAVRESVLVATEQRLSRRVEELGALQQRLEALDKAAREREDSGWRGLVRIYENMRPRDAARIFNELEMVTLVEVVDRMRERTAAPILAGMEPEKAKALTAELARRRSTGPRAEAGG